MLWLRDSAPLKCRKKSAAKIKWSINNINNAIKSSYTY